LNADLKPITMIYRVEKKEKAVMAQPEEEVRDENCMEES
jgi:hypothetical protein